MLCGVMFVEIGTELAARQGSRVVRPGEIGGVEEVDATCEERVTLHAVDRRWCEAYLGMPPSLSLLPLAYPISAQGERPTAGFV